MHQIDIQNYYDEFVLHYGGQIHSLEASVFAKSLLELTNILQEINYFSNPECNIEVRVEALYQGSFRPKIRLLFLNSLGEIKNFLPDKKETIPILIALVALAGSASSKIINKNNEIILEQNNYNISMSKETYESAQKLAKNKNIAKSLSKHFELMDKTLEVESFGILPEKSSDEYSLYISRAHFKGFIGLEEKIVDDLSEQIIPNAELKMVKLVLERGARKWEFVWNGQRISAAILDDQFWDDFEQNHIEIGSGDTMRAHLKIKKKYDQAAKVYINDDYEIIKVQGFDRSYQQKDDLFQKTAKK